MTASTDARSRFVEAQDSLLERYDLAGASSFVDIEGPVDTVHVLEAGEGEPTLLLSGVASPAALFVPLLAELADDRRLIAVDRPGRGLSDPYRHTSGDVRPFTMDTIDGVLDACGLETVDLIGSSFGGFQALAYALDRPDRVGRISLVGSAAGLTRSLPLSFRLLGVKGINRLLFRLSADETTDDVRETMASMNVEDPSALDDALLEVILAGGQLPEQRRSLKTLFETTAGIRGVSPHMLVFDELQELASPVQFLWGSEDFFYEPAVGREAADRIEEAEFIELPGHGHTPWLEPDNDVAEYIRDFV